MICDAHIEHTYTTDEKYCDRKSQAYKNIVAPEA